MNHSEFSRKGGQSKSPAKMRAIKANLEKANKAKADKKASTPAREGKKP